MSLRFLHKHPDALSRVEEQYLAEIAVWYDNKIRRKEFVFPILV